MKGRGTKSKGAPTPKEQSAPRAKAAGVADGDETSPKHRMPMDHVRWILAQKPMAPPPRYAALKQRNPDLTPLPGEEADEELMELYFVAKAFYEMEEKFPKTQEWVREEMRTKGYVEVSDEWVKQRAARDELIDREWPKIQAKLEAIKQQIGQGGEVDENDCCDYDDEY